MPKDAPKPPRHVAVALIFSPDQHKLLMVTSRKHPTFWILPKGGIEEGESSGQAAVRESWEEAGTPKNLTAPPDEDRLSLLDLTPSSKHKRSSVWHVQLLTVPENSLEAADDWPERSERSREWVTPREVLRRIQAWYTDSSLASEVDDVVAGSVEIKSKMYKKGGAMEQALKAFIDLKGWGDGET